MEFKEVPYGSALYQKSVELRDVILRKPLGLQFSKKDLAKEVTDHHLVCIEGEEVIGVILLRPVTDNHFKMRQVAVAESFQYKGIGTKLVDFCETFCNENGVKKISMHARNKAIPFYERLDYYTVGDLFYEVGIPHFKMEKEL